MDINTENAYWFVGAIWDNDDQMPRFVEQGIWENGYDNRYLDVVRSVQPGERIAIKSAYTKKKNLPFQANGNTASVMSIKVLGTVTANPGDGKRLEVQWNEPLSEEKKWFFYTNRSTIWEVRPNRWLSRGLIDFAFNDIPQEYDRFRNDPYWKSRFGDQPEKADYPWTPFYEAVADKLLSYKDRPSDLQALIQELTLLIDPESDHLFSAPLSPFSVIALLNQDQPESQRLELAQALALRLEIEDIPPINFSGIPVLPSQSFIDSVGDSHLTEQLWQLFESALKYADQDDSDSHRDTFIQDYNSAITHEAIGLPLTTALFWIRPWSFLSLDHQTRTYMVEKLKITLPNNESNTLYQADHYLQLLQTTETRFQEEGFSVHSYPELTQAAQSYQPLSNKKSRHSWRDRVYQLIQELCQETDSAEFNRLEFQERFLDQLTTEYPTNNTVASTVDRTMQVLRDDSILQFLNSGHYRWLEFEQRTHTQPYKKPVAQRYTLQSITEEGCFLSPETLEQLIVTLKRKKNLILQGAPGTGKTWLAKRLAYALTGYKLEDRVRAVQFHPNLSYEDFIRGWRPTGGAQGLELVDGPFLEMVSLAQNTPEIDYVIVIEEVNRGNPAQIFGEMLTLLEADKRTPDESLELSYGTDEDKRIYIPENLFVIGTMNIADRSLALVDLALRRRFAFIELEPQLNERWEHWLQTKLNITDSDLSEVKHRMNQLNQSISDDPMLGKQFRIGHSYVTPANVEKDTQVKAWFMEVAQTEILPLLQEYYFDAPEKAQEQYQQLIQGW